MIARKVSPKGRSVRVTFQLPAQCVSSAATVVGSFNDWDAARHPMKLDNTNGVWTKTIAFRPGETIQFRYLVDGHRWRNDDEADSYAATPFFSENGVLEL